jgi:hypothetical protein
VAPKHEFEHDVKMDAEARVHEGVKSVLEEMPRLWAPGEVPSCCDGQRRSPCGALGTSRIPTSGLPWPTTETL